MRISDCGIEHKITIFGFVKSEAHSAICIPHSELRTPYPKAMSNPNNAPNGVEM